MGYDASASLFYGLEIESVDTDMLETLLQPVEGIGYCHAGIMDNQQLYLCQYYETTDWRSTFSKIDINELKNFVPEPDRLIEFCRQHNIQYSGYPSWYLTASYD